MRYWLDAEGPDPKAIGKGLLWLFKNTPSGTISLLAVPVLDNLTDGTIEALIGTVPAKNLAKGGSMKLPSGGFVTVMTERKVPSGWKGGPVLAAYPTKRLLDIIDDLPLVTDVFVVPWVKDDVSGWVKKWNASEYEGAQQPSKTPVGPDPVVVEALKSLSSAVNKSTGLTNSTDRDTAIQTFRILADAGIPFDPAMTESFLVRECSWETRHAKSVFEVASRIMKGDRLRMRGGPVLRPDILDIWRQDAGVK